MNWQALFAVLGVIASIFGIVTGVPIVFRWIAPRRPNHQGVMRAPTDFDMVPFWFQLDLVNALPRVTVHVYAINFTRWKVELSSASIRAISLLQTNLSEPIDLSDPYTLLPHSATHVTFSRAISPAEVALLLPRAQQVETAAHGAVAVRATWKAWRTHRYTMVGESAIHGQLLRNLPKPEEPDGRRMISPGIRVV